MALREFKGEDLTGQVWVRFICFGDVGRTFTLPYPLQICGEKTLKVFKTFGVWRIYQVI